MGVNRACGFGNNSCVCINVLFFNIIFFISLHLVSICLVSVVVFVFIYLLCSGSDFNTDINLIVCSVASTNDFACASLWLRVCVSVLFGA